MSFQRYPDEPAVHAGHACVNHLFARAVFPQPGIPTISDHFHQTPPARSFMPVGLLAARRSRAYVFVPSLVSPEPPIHDQIEPVCTDQCGMVRDGLVVPWCPHASHRFDSAMVQPRGRALKAWRHAKNAHSRRHDLTGLDSARPMRSNGSRGHRRRVTPPSRALPKGSAFASCR